MGQIAKRIGPTTLNQAGVEVYQVRSGANSQTSALTVSATLTNYSDNDVVIEANLYQAGGSPANSNKLLHQQSVPANTVIDVYPLINKTLNSGDVVFFISDTDDSVNITLGVFEQF